MKKLFLVAALFGCSTIGLTAQVTAKEMTMWQEYKAAATHTSQLIKSGSYDEIGNSAANLVTIANDILPAFAHKKPQCKVYLDAVLAASESMQSLSLEAIEADYHADGKLPALTSGECYHAKDLLVHPATVVVMAKTLSDNKKERKHMSHEIDEVLMHLDQVAATVLK
ncbi:hypothetical protein [Psychrobium sp. 1_MG-2023]|uniref:hypothetical protein n=1 Tax=Psychrobium sp. 1_MG-2023 TaxID=3062624 RepID=UPI000C34B7BF|nr:hypothetical protein [Psychrobium sp. 1_MG-2023]MDP2561654.1 hypothetical protein [Psychrobium sp. 1_MG-2023]PKF55670.1 hypothetical protein CW748_12500 [Alteromonadales bacterium alter-6D02]